MIPFPTTCTASFTLDRPAHEALALFTAEGERAWAPGWDPQLLSGDGTQRGSVFRTRSPEGVTTTWVMVAHDRAHHRLSYARFAEGMHVGLVDVRLEDRAPGACVVTVGYTLSAVSDSGSTQVAAALDPDAFERFIGGWKDLIETATSRRTEG